MPQGLDCMKDGFTAKVCEQFQWLNKEELDQAMDIVMRANFAGDPVTKEETMQLRGLIVTPAVWFEGHEPQKEVSFPLYQSICLKLTL